MSPPQQPHDVHNVKIDAPEGGPYAENAKNMPASGALDPEALTSIELNAAPDATTQHKRDDPYLVCFDEGYDTEK